MRKKVNQNAVRVVQYTAAHEALAELYTHAQLEALTDKITGLDEETAVIAISRSVRAAILKTARRMMRDRKCAS